MEKKILNKTEQYFKNHQAIHTATEINQQPKIWEKVAQQMIDRKQEVEDFMELVNASENSKIVFTGAGSSAFVGEVMQYIIADECNLEATTIHTTDIISSPDSTLFNRPTLLVSYARSGESPESVAAIKFAKKRIKNLYNLIFVCDGESSLAKLGNETEKTLVITLPKETCDQGFAMTSSVSSMALATWMVFHYKNLNRYAKYVTLLAKEVHSVMDDFANKAEEFVMRDYRRLVWLGSGPLQGLAQEGAVKSMELSNGYTHASYDGAAAFRHGPKTVINDETVLIHFISSHPYTKQYDIDLNNEINSEKVKNATITIAEEGIQEFIPKSDLYIEYPKPSFLTEATQMDSYIYGLVFAQLLSMFKSIQLGYTTDNPCPKGDVNRIVKGIIIYDIS